jgi:hypothetical protein
MARLESIDQQDTDAADVTRVVESDVADTIALRGRGGGSSFEREMDALPFVGEMSRDCKPCRGFGVIPLSEDKQESWKRHLADLRLQLARVPPGKDGDTDRERFGDALADGIAGYRKACRCAICDGLGKLMAPGTTLVRQACDRCGGSGKDRGRTCQKCQGRKTASLGIPDSCWNTVSCWRCHGGGEVRDEDAQDVCPVCNGEKYTQPITVRETGCSKKGRLPPGYEPADDTDHGSSSGSVSVPDDFAVSWNDGDELSQKARGATLLEQLRETDHDAAADLDAFYGADGDHYAKVTQWGRGHALWPRTEGGKALLREAAENGGYSKPLAALAAMRAAEAASSVKNIPRQAHMRAAVSESRERIERARKALAGIAGL